MRLNVGCRKINIKLNGSGDRRLYRWPPLPFFGRKYTVSWFKILPPANHDLPDSSIPHISKRFNPLRGVAVTVSAGALVVRMVSRNQRAVDEATSWLKRIVITWIVLNSLGFIVTYLQPLVSSGSYTAP